MEELIDTKIDGDSVTTENWEWDGGVEYCKTLYKRLKDDFSGTVLEFWRAHKAIVHEKKFPGRTWKKFCDEVGIAPRTPREWFDKLELRGRNLPPPKPAKKHTKPDVKLQLGNVGKAIKKGEVSDDDVKGLLKNTAEAIDNEICHTRVGSDVIYAIRRKAQEHAVLPKNKKDRTEIEETKLIVQRAADRLWNVPVDHIPPEDRINWEAIRRCGPSMIMNFAKLGVDPRKVMDFTEGREDVNNRDQIESCIEAEWKVLD